MSTETPLREAETTADWVEPRARVRSFVAHRVPGEPSSDGPCASSS